MKIKNLKELNNINSKELERLKDEALNNFLNNENINKNQVSASYHVFQFHGEDSWQNEGQEEEALKDFKRMCKNYEDQSHIVLNVARTDIGETQDDEDLYLVSFQISDDYFFLIDKVKNKILSYHDTENYIVRKYDENDQEMEHFYIFNRNEKEAFSEAQADVVDAHDWSLTKIDIQEWIQEEYNTEKEVAEEIKNMVLSK